MKGDFDRILNTQDWRTIVEDEDIRGVKSVTWSRGKVTGGDRLANAVLLTCRCPWIWCIRCWVAAGFAYTRRRHCRGSCRPAPPPDCKGKNLFFCPKFTYFEHSLWNHEQNSPVPIQGALHFTPWLTCSNKLHLDFSRKFQPHCLYTNIQHCLMPEIHPFTHTAGWTEAM